MSYRWECTSVNVPLNKKGLRELERGNTAMLNVLSIHFSEQEIDILWPMFFKFCDEFDLLIDLAEEEDMPFECLERALVIAKSYLDTVSTNPIGKEATGKVIHAIEAAIKAKTYVEFSL